MAAVTSRRSLCVVCLASFALNSFLMTPDDDANVAAVTPRLSLVIVCIALFAPNSFLMASDVDANTVSGAVESFN